MPYWQVDFFFFKYEMAFFYGLFNLMVVILCLDFLIFKVVEYHRECYGA